VPQAGQFVITPPDLLVVTTDIEHLFGTMTDVDGFRLAAVERLKVSREAFRRALSRASL
jgi:hypothetical protein